LLGIKERAALAGGRARIFSSPGQGTTVEISLPLDGASRASPSAGIS
jgi:signal transduction histidine kinase